MDQPMRWVCLCLDAHNFVVGSAPRADEISRMMHRSHVQPPVPRQPASSLHAAKPNSHLRFGIAGPTWVAECPFLNPPPTVADKALRQALDEGEHDDAGGDFSAADGSHLSGVEGIGTRGQLSIRPYHGAAFNGVLFMGRDGVDF